MNRGRSIAFTIACLLGVSMATPARAAETLTPIQHLIVIYQENVSFDHYFGTFPNPLIPLPSKHFEKKKLDSSVAGIATTVPSGQPAPFRLGPEDAVTADQDHGYRAEQLAFNQGRMDRFPEAVGRGSKNAQGTLASSDTVMGYYDGNTVSALWFYALNFALGDHFFADTFGPSTPGALEVVAGQTHGAQITYPPSATRPDHTPYALLSDQRGGWTVIGDLDPAQDRCSDPDDPQISMIGENIGTLLDRSGVTWGEFMGGFDLTVKNPNGSTGCHRSHRSGVSQRSVLDYVPHHNSFQYYPGSANPTHARPSDLTRIGYGTAADGVTPEPAHHEYDLDDFFYAAMEGNFPAVSYIRAPAYQDGHAGYSNPLDEQEFLVSIINFIQQQKEWSSTAIIITYDDSDGWYDHLTTPIQHPSRDSWVDQLNGPGQCGHGGLPMGIDGQGVNGRCGPGPRLPIIVISPWVKPHHIEHGTLTQSSIVRFIEDNWLHGERLGGGSFDQGAGSLMGFFDFNPHRVPVAPLRLDPVSGFPVDASTQTPE